MEWVRDPHKVRRRNRTICILNRVTSVWSGDASPRCGSAPSAMARSS
jgi:hypothetical protein